VKPTVRFEWIAAFVLGAAALGAQAPAPPRPSGLVMGTVVDSLTGKPVPGAIITLGSSKVKADDDGRFVFADLPRGNYAIEASKAGYLDGAYGRRRPDGPSATLALGADERIGNLRIPIFRFGAISGQVLDEVGEPVVGAEVSVLARSWVGGRLVLTRGDSALTDDRGAYRIGALGPGEFVVAAILKSLPVMRKGVAFMYPVTYFPGSTAVDQSAPVTLKVGDDRGGVDIPLRLGAAFKVSGVLKTPSAPQTGVVTLAPAGEEFGAVSLSAAEVTSEPNGGFEFLAVPAGAFVARSVVRPPPQRTESSQAPTRLMWASAPVFVVDADVRNLEVLLRPGYRISGRVIIDIPAGTRAGFEMLRRLTASIESPDVDVRALGEAATVGVDVLGRFSTTELPPGRYFIRFENPPPGWSIRDITVRGRDISNAPIRLDSDVTDVTITFTDKPTELGGLVRSDSGTVDGSTVLAFPRDRAAWIDFGRKPLGLRATRSSRDGSFRFAGLPPGDYFVVAVDDTAAVDWQQPKRLELLASSASQVTLAKGESRQLDLRLAAIR
jgi:hypothetical protein